MPWTPLTLADVGLDPDDYLPGQVPIMQSSGLFAPGWRDDVLTDRTAFVNVAASLPLPTVAAEVGTSVPALVNVAASLPLPTVAASIVEESGSAYNAVVLADSPIHFWPLDETAGTTAEDVVGTLDLSHLDSPTVGAAGLIDDYAVDYPTLASQSASAINLPLAFDSGVDFSVEVWWQGTSQGDSFALLFGSGNRNWRFLRSGTTANVIFAVNTSGHGFTASDVLDGTRRHLVGVYESSTVRFYLDGVQVGTRASTTTAADSVAAARLAADGSFRRAIGKADKAAVYDYALTASQVAAHYAAGIA